ncbi:MAG: sugar/nucleoside kinase (ribokinase family) [Kiritimatiellia bacterium]|jgi:sugar/nucleoside kinase (ribokinase family)
MSIAKPDQVREMADAIEQSAPHQSVLAGFDGFVDEIMSVVDQRMSSTEFEPLETITEFGEKVSKAAGLSTNFELVPRQIKLGGNGPIVANAIAKHAYPVHYIGALGVPNIHPVYLDFAAHCASVCSIADPGHTYALEFNDGKIMMGKGISLHDVCWEKLQAALPEPQLTDRLHAAGLLVLNNWTMLPYMNEIYHEFIRILGERAQRPRIFIDLADPAKRPRDEIAEVTRIITAMQAVADVTFGMNEKESTQVAQVVLGVKPDDLTDRAERLRAKLDLEMVVIHPTHSAAVASRTEGAAVIDGPFTPNPKLTTGAGDNFNAGFCVGLLSNLPAAGCLISGVCTSGFYVRQARSAKRPELVDFMRRWADAGCGAMP